MNKKLILVVFMLILLIVITLVVAEIFIDDKSGITIKNCESCYTNSLIGFDYEKEHFIIPRYDFQGDRLKDPEKIKWIAEYLNKKTQKPLPSIVDTNKALREGVLVK